MSTAIRILAIVAAVLVAFSLLLLLISIPLQPLITKGMGYPEHFIGDLPQFPLLPFLSYLLRLVCVALLVICCGSKKGGIWLELLVLAALAVVLPCFSTIASRIYIMIVNGFGGSDYYAIAVSIVNSISSFCTIPANFGIVLAYVTCGMSISYKLTNKKLEQAESLSEEEL